MFKKIGKYIQTANKKTIIIATALLLCLTGTLTYAWFTSSDQVENHFNSKFKFEVNVVDKFDPPTDFTEGNLVKKEVSAKNTGSLDAFVRVMVFPVAVDKDKKPLAIDGNIVINYQNLNTTDWLNGQDGYYYYLKKLTPGETAPNLFDGVTLTIPPEKETLYKGANFDIEVKSEAIDIRDSAYREGFWNIKRDQAPTDNTLKAIDDAYQLILSTTKGAQADEK